MKSRSVTNIKEIEQIINSCEICHLSMVTPEGKPYLVAMNFVYFDNSLYFHSSQHGTKIKYLRNNPEVCVAFSNDHVLRFQHERVACSYSMKYKSVHIYGKIEFIEDFDSKKQVMTQLMKHYTDKDFEFNEPSIREICVYKVNIENLICRVYGY